MKRRPEKQEYSTNFDVYIKLVPKGELSLVLANQLEDTIKLLEHMTDEQGNYRYAADKWSIKEVLGHITDVERVMGYRLLLIARGETAMLPKTDRDLFNLNAAFHRLSIPELLEDLKAVRQATLSLIRHLTPEAWLKQGNINGNQVNVLALACIISGHELHHINILKERYLTL